ncbi:acyl-CoA thioesterase [Candidatus Micrarchaeota archaeon]|nr:acyl-CoA thioesterase [Candidatus Micrarchaeota archaeon]
MEEKISVGVAEVIDVVMPGQTNHYGTLFGGVLMAMMDKAANIAAIRYCKNDCVTVSVDNIVFEKPVKLGEIIIAKARLIYVGKSSMVIRVRADAENKLGERKTIISCADFLFVAVDKVGKPIEVPKPILQNKEEELLFKRGNEIKENLKRLC